MRNHRLLLLTIAGAAAAILASSSPAQEPGETSTLRVGTFDSRAVAIAFYRSPPFQERVAGLLTESRAARESGDAWRVMQIEKYKPAMSHRMHQQGFSTGSVREIMQELDTELQRVAEDAGVSVIISRWEVAFSNPAVELIDVTPQVVALIDSSEEALAMIRDIQESEPVPWEQLLAHEEDRRPIVDEIRPVIDEQGVEAGIGRYLELRDAACEHHRAQLEAAAEEYDFSEAQLNELGYYYLSAGETEIAIEIFKLNVEAYPKAFNTYDSLGEGYMEAGQTDLAVENYMRSLELNPENDNARQMLERMGVEHEDAG